jgi:hypothetical protein
VGVGEDEWHDKGTGTADLIAVASALFYSHTKIKQKSKLGGLGKGIKESKMPDNCE